jgi:hypothetical protein
MCVPGRAGCPGQCVPAGVSVPGRAGVPDSVFTGPECALQAGLGVPDNVPRPDCACRAGLGGVAGRENF